MLGTYYQSRFSFSASSCQLSLPLPLFPFAISRLAREIATDIRFQLLTDDYLRARIYGIKRRDLRQNVGRANFTLRATFRFWPADPRLCVVGENLVQKKKKKKKRERAHRRRKCMKARRRWTKSKERRARSNDVTTGIRIYARVYCRKR